MEPTYLTTSYFFLFPEAVDQLFRAGGANLRRHLEATEARIFSREKPDGFKGKKLKILLLYTSWLKYKHWFLESILFIIVLLKSVGDLWKTKLGELLGLIGVKYLLLKQRVKMIPMDSQMWYFMLGGWVETTTQFCLASVSLEGLP